MVFHKISIRSRKKEKCKKEPWIFKKALFSFYFVIVFKPPNNGFKNIIWLPHASPDAAASFTVQYCWLIGISHVAKVLIVVFKFQISLSSLIFFFQLQYTKEFLFVSSKKSIVICFLFCLNCHCDEIRNKETGSKLKGLEIF